MQLLWPFVGADAGLLERVSAACLPVVILCAFQFFTFRYFRWCNERARRIEEEGVSATSEVLRQITTVRQMAAEQRSAAKYARRNLSRQLIGESRVRGFELEGNLISDLAKVLVQLINI